MQKKKIANFILAALITTISATTLGTTSAFADTKNINNTNNYIQQIYTDNNSDITYEKIEYNDKTIIVIKSLTGEILNTIEEYNNSTYVDGVKIEMNVNNEFEHKNTPENYQFDNYSRQFRSAISWGQWQNCETIKIKTGGLSSAVIAGLIALKLGWNPFGAAATVASLVAGKYEMIEIKGQIRYGSSGNGRYIHYERKSHIYGDGKFIKTLTDSGKKAA